MLSVLLGFDSSRNSNFKLYNLKTTHFYQHKRRYILGVLEFEQIRLKTILIFKTLRWLAPTCWPLLAMISLVFLTFITYVTILVWLRCRGSKVKPIPDMYDRSGETKKDWQKCKKFFIYVIWISLMWTSKKPKDLPSFSWHGSVKIKTLAKANHPE